MHVISFAGRRRYGAVGKEDRAVDLGQIRLLSSVLRPPISDIVKRKRIRSGRKTDDGDKDGSMIRSLILRPPSSPPEQPVVGLSQA
jgi:hypothetical protein